MKRKKYKLDKKDTKKTPDGKTLYRIIALVDVGKAIHAGEAGGYIESEHNLSQVGNAWVSENAQVFERARIFGNAQVSGDAWVFGRARIYGNADYFCAQ